MRDRAEERSKIKARGSYATEGKEWAGNDKIKGDDSGGYAY